MRTPRAGNGSNEPPSLNTACLSFEQDRPVAVSFTSVLISMSDRLLNRRAFLKGAAVLGTGVWLGIGRERALSTSPNDRLNIGIVGVGNRAEANISGVKGQNIVALCDIDEDFLRGAA